MFPDDPGGAVGCDREIGIHGEERLVAELQGRLECPVGADTPDKHMKVMPIPGIPSEPDSILCGGSEGGTPGRLGWG